MKSGAIEFLFQLLKPIFEMLHFPLEVFPMAIMRPISGTASFAMLSQIFNYLRI